MSTSAALSPDLFPRPDGVAGDAPMDSDLFPLPGEESTKAYRATIYGQHDEETTWTLEAEDLQAATRYAQQHPTWVAARTASEDDPAVRAAVSLRVREA